MAVAGASARERLVHWCTQQLRKTFSLDVSEEIIQVSPCSPGCPGACSVNQAGLNITEIHLPLPLEFWD